jgi:hypothetical protein
VPEAGEYTIVMIGRENTDHGIAHVYINNVDVAQVDFYAGSSEYNAVKTETLGTLTKGYKWVKIAMDSKNASSSDYLLRLQHIFIYKS